MYAATQHGPDTTTSLGHTRLWPTSRDKKRCILQYDSSLPYQISTRQLHHRVVTTGSVIVWGRSTKSQRARTKEASITSPKARIASQATFLRRLVKCNMKAPKPFFECAIQYLPRLPRPCSTMFHLQFKPVGHALPRLTRETKERRKKDRLEHHDNDVQHTHIPPFLLSCTLLQIDILPLKSLSHIYQPRAPLVSRVSI